MKFNRLLLISATCCLSLTACGGGGGGGDSAATTSSVSTDSSAEGAYVGTLSGSSNTAFQMLVLDDGTFWTLYGVQQSGMFYVNGFVQGQGSFANGKFSSTNAKDFGYSPAMAGSVNGTYTSSPSISGTVTSKAGSVSFSGAPDPASTYNYQQAATISTIAGVWNMTVLTGETVSLNVSNTGALGGVSSAGCAYSGTVTPRASGKNVYDVRLQFGASPCALPGQVANGIAVAYAVDGGKTQLVVAAVDSTRTYGVAALASR